MSDDERLRLAYEQLHNFSLEEMAKACDRAARFEERLLTDSANLTNAAKVLRALEIDRPPSS